MMNPIMVRLTVVSSPRSLVCLEPRARMGNACFRQPNARLHLLPEAGATQERRLEAVRCKPLLGAGTGTGLRLGDTSRRLPPTTAPGRRERASGAHRLAGHAHLASMPGEAGHRLGSLGLPLPASHPTRTA